MEIDDDEDDGTLTLSYDGEGGGMPDAMCGSIRFAGLEADGAPGVAAEGHRRALMGVRPAIRSTAGRLAAHYVPGTPVYGRPLPDIDGLLAGQDLAGSYARALDEALTRAASEEREALARVVAEDAREASWMAAASFFNTIAHRVGLFQAAAHNVPSVALPVPSLDEWTPAADAAVKGVAAQLARSRDYHPMLLSAANAGAGALPASGNGEGGMVAGLLEFIDLDSVIVADSGNPIADLAALGHGLLNAALAAVAALMGAATRLRAAGNPSPSSARASTCSSPPGRSPTRWSRPCWACSSSPARCWPTCCRRSPSSAFCSASSAGFSTSP